MAKSELHHTPGGELLIVHHSVKSDDDIDPCPKGDPECVTGDDGSCHDACESDAEYIARLREPLLHYFGTTDPELLAEVWEDRAKRDDDEHRAASDEPRVRYKVPSDLGYSTGEDGLCLARPFVLCDTPEEAAILAAVLAEVAACERTPAVDDDERLRLTDDVLVRKLAATAIIELKRREAPRLSTEGA